MQELRFVAVSEDGSYAVLAVPGRSARYTLPIDERLRAVALGQTSRLAQYEIEVESPLRPKEIQARIRAGETAEEIADAAGIPVERVRWFEGPVLAERAYIAQQAQAASVRRPGDSSGPGPRLADIVPSRLKALGADPDDGQWDARKRGDGNWQLTLTFTAAGRLHVAEWMFDTRRRHVLPEDDNAARLSLPEAELPPLLAPMPGEATVTPLAPRLGAVSAGGMGGAGPVGGSGPSGGGRFRAERPAASERSGASERPAAPERPAMSHTPAASPTLPRPAHRDPVPERPPAASGTASDDSERSRPAPQHPLVFEEQDPDALDIQPPIEPPPIQPAASVQPEPTATPPIPEPAAAEPAAEEAPARSRAGKKNPRGRRSSVPSWDEIMLGSSRQRD
ncbi:MAG TPA: septation protein SepH [Trebonia sp.]|jgi:hypothetical protein|nr:septation protein SepH [Trebonia sp.]